MLMKRYFIFGLGILLCKPVISQSPDESRRYIQSATGGTALSIGMGGATGAVGADFSNAATNPAGIGLYRRNEMAFSPSLFNFSSNATFYGTQEDDRKFNFNFSNLHMVLHFPSENKLKTKGWLSTTLGFGFNRNNGLHQRFTLRGVNPESSIASAYASVSQGIAPGALDPTGAKMFYDAYLIDLDTSAANPNTYYPAWAMPYGGATQRITMETAGRLSETNIVFAANHSNRLYLGGTLAIRRIMYEQNLTHTERNETDSAAWFNSLEYSRRYTDRGLGVGFRLGAIYRVQDWVRIGGSVLIPLDYNMKTYYSSELKSTNGAIQNFHSNLVEGSYDYKFRQAFRYTGSMAFIIGKHGIVSVDYEGVDHSSTKFVTDDGALDSGNDRMRAAFRKTGNLRIGAEARFNDNYLRAGYQKIASALTNTQSIGDINQFSIGAGYRNDGFLVDLAYAYSIQKENFAPYNPDLAPVQTVPLSFNRHILVLTLGTRF